MLKQIWKSSTNFHESPQYQITRKSVQWQLRWYMLTDGHSWLCRCRHMLKQPIHLEVLHPSEEQSTRRSISEDLNLQCKSTYSSTGRQDTTVGVVIWLRDGQLRQWGSILVTEERILFSTASRITLGSTEPLIQRLPRCHSSGIKRIGHEACHSHPSTARIRIPQLRHTSSQFGS